MLCSGQNIPSGHTILGHKPDHLNRHQVPVNADGNHYNLLKQYFFMLTCFCISARLKGGKHYEENFQGRKF